MHPQPGFTLIIFSMAAPLLFTTKVCVTSFPSGTFEKTKFDSGSDSDGNAEVLFFGIPDFEIRGKNDRAFPFPARDTPECKKNTIPNAIIKDNHIFLISLLFISEVIP